jgi:hypothetical protein
LPLDNDKAIAATQMPPIVSQNGLRKTTGNLTFNEFLSGANLTGAGMVKVIVFLPNDLREGSW